MDNNGSTAIVVVAHRKYETLEKCINGLAVAAKSPEDLIFVDNGSEERLLDWAKSRFPDISVIRLQKNGYFCAGYNAGITAAMERGYEFVLIINSDTEVVNPSFIDELILAARRWPRAAFIGPLVYFRSRDIKQSTYFGFPNAFYHMVAWLPWRLAPGLFLPQLRQETSVDVLNNVCVLCRIDALKEIGLLDETFGMYIEDIDWSWRSRKKEWVSVFSPVPSIIHHQSATGYEYFSLTAFLLKRNTVFWFLKVGRVQSAFLYSIMDTVLMWTRILFSVKYTDRKKLIFVAKKLARAYWHMLRGDKPGEWFGPPISPWKTGRENA